MSHGAGGLLLRSIAGTRASIVCSLSGHDYDAVLPRSSLNAHSSDREIDTVRNEFSSLGVQCAIHFLRVFSRYFFLFLA